MPGTPDPVLGSDALTFAIACATSALVASLPYVLRDRLPTPSRFALGGGIGYALLCLGAWAGARFATDAFANATPRLWALVVSVGVVVLGAHAAVPYYIFARWKVVAPLAGLFAATTLVLDVFLRVRGESDPLALYVLFFGPIVVVGLCVLGSLEIGVRRLVARARS